MPLLALALVLQSHVPLPAIDVRRLELSPPARVLELSLEEMKGDVDRLAWSPDGQRLYVRAAKADRWGNRRVWHYEIRLADKQLRALEREPDWYVRYWSWKSAQSAPGAPGFRMAYETRQERKTATGVAGAGAMAQSGGDPTLGSELGPQGQAIAATAMQGQMVTTTTIVLRGELLAEFVNTPAIPGLTFGWAPAGMDALAYAGKRGRLLIMDRAGRKRDIAAAKDVLLPAWSEDGVRLAWIQREEKKTLALVLMDVSIKN